MSDHVMERLVHVFGRARGEQLYAETLESIGLPAIGGPNDEMRFADALIGRGGLHEAIGRSLRVRALLHGASRASP